MLRQSLQVSSWGKHPCSLAGSDTLPSLGPSHPETPMPSRALVLLSRAALPQSLGKTMAALGQELSQSECSRALRGDCYFIVQHQ